MEPGMRIQVEVEMKDEGYGRSGKTKGVDEVQGEDDKFVNIWVGESMHSIVKLKEWSLTLWKELMEGMKTMRIA